MTVKLVYQPSVIPIARTMMDPDALYQWAEDHGFLDIYNEEGTPLGILAEDLSDGHDIEQNSLDALPEFAGRFCYRSFAKGRKRDAYIKNIIDMEHGSVLEHSVVSFAVSGISRSLTHELIRHRAGASPSQESQRYVDAKDIRFVVPPLIAALSDPELTAQFEADCAYSLQAYERTRDALNLALDAAQLKGHGIKFDTMKKKRALEAARSVLFNAAETRMVWTMNMRAARHVCALRGAEGADLEIRRLAVEFTKHFKEMAPHIFADFEIGVGDDGFPLVKCDKPKV